MMNEDDDFDVVRMWRESQAEFQRICQRALNDKKQNLSVEEVVASLSRVKDKDEKKAMKYKNAKVVLTKTLNCVQLLGGLAAQGASVVFSPSQMCFNAVSQVIQVAQKYSAIAAGVAALFERIWAFLWRFERYMEMQTLGKSLRKILHELLLCFIRICALSVKVADENSVKLFFEVLLFDEDKGIRAERDRLETLVQNELQLTAVEIMDDVKKGFKEVTTQLSTMIANQNDENVKLNVIDLQVKDLGEDVGDVSSKVDLVISRTESAEKRRDAEATMKKRVSAIKKALNVDKELWRDDQQEQVDSLVPGTGEWLMEDPDFRRWATPDNLQSLIFSLEAKEGFGKTHLCSVVARFLLKMYPAGSKDPFVSVAYYFFRRRTKEEKPFRRALEAIIYQLTESNEAYQKTVAALCQKAEDSHEHIPLADLWRELVVELPKTDATFFVLLDGIDQIEPEMRSHVQKMMTDLVAMAESSDAKSLRMKFLLTGRPEAFADIIPGELGSKICRKSLGSMNRDDVEKYINWRMDQMDTLKDTKSDIQDLRMKIRTELSEGVPGDFVRLDIKLTEISKKDQRNEILEVLKHADEDRQDSIVRVIEQLNHSLGEKNIGDLNEILTFMIGAKVWPTTLQLEGVLQIKNGEKPLRPLAELVRVKYADLLELDDPESENSKVLLKSDSTMDTLKSLSDSLQTSNSENTVCHPAEVAIVERFLRMVCDDALYKRFGFEEFLQRKLRKNNSIIFVDYKNMARIMLEYCLKALTSNVGAIPPSLVEYAAMYVDVHLKDVDLDQESPEKKRELGESLIKLFWDEEVIIQWWVPERLSMRPDWVYGDSCVEAVLTWFEDSSVAQKFTPKQRQWVQNLISKSNTENHLLKPTAVIMAKNWIQGPELETRAVMYWLLGFLSKIQPSKTAEKDTNFLEQVYDADECDPKAADILAAERWCKGELKSIDVDSHWHTRIAITLKMFSQFDEALAKCHEALEMNPNEWKVSYIVAQIYAQQAKHTEAVDLMRKIFEQFRDTETVSGEDRRLFKTEMMQDLADWEKELKHYDAALIAYMEVDDNLPEEYRNPPLIIDILNNMERYVEVTQYLQKLSTLDDPRGGVGTRLTSLLSQTAGDENFHSIISHAAHVSNHLNDLKCFYHDAVKTLEAGKSSVLLLTALLHLRGCFLYGHCEAHEDHDEAINIWHEVIRLAASQMSRESVRYVRFKTVKRLASFYLQEARKAGFDSEKAKECCEKLEALADHPAEEDEDRFISDDAQLLLGRFQYLMGNKEKARDCMRGLVQNALNLLSDDDPTNDYIGWTKLANILSPMNDDENAILAWRMNGPCEPDGNLYEETADAQGGASSTSVTKDAPRAEPNPDNQDQVMETPAKVPDDETAEALKPSPLKPNEKEEDEKGNEEYQKEEQAPQAPLSAPPALQGYLGYRCDGHCGHHWTYADDIWACRDCIDIQFESSCLEKLRNGTLVRKICDPHHEFLHVPKFDAEVWGKVKKDELVVGGVTVTVKGWLNLIRKEWGFEVTQEEAEAEALRERERERTAEAESGSGSGSDGSDGSGSETSDEDSD